MTIERALRLIAGTVVLVSLALSVFHSQNWLFLTAFVGLNLFQSGFSNWCPMMWILEKTGLHREVKVASSKEGASDQLVV
ncbi:MAG: DUF2892 domain-containing protein [Nitrospira sp.]|nr:DUF2892 domain-containing protein [Candidatus Manganitrophaceae bacterium]HIL33823.1 DUF2892 domain-containing protein [Candidatus Manganitrophaceae bacterium]